MTNLQKLTAFMKEHLPARLFIEFDSYMDDPSLSIEFRDMGQGQIKMGAIEYKAVLSWDRYPYREFDTRIIFCLVMIWFAQFKDEYQDRYSFEDPIPDPEIIDDEVSFLNITVCMLDEIYIVPDENGPIPFNGQRYRVDDPEIWTAEAALIYGAGNTGGVVNQNDPL